MSRWKAFVPGFVTGIAVAVCVGGPMRLGLVVGGATLVGWAAGWAYRDVLDSR